MNKVLLDSSFVISLVERGIPLGQVAFGLGAALVDQRLRNLESKLDSQSTRIVIPTPVLAEVLVRRLRDKESVLRTLNDTPRIAVAHFGAAAAIEAAEMLYRHLPGKAERDEDWSKHRLKFDLQILAIAKVEGVATIYANDRGLIGRAKAEGLKTLSFRDLTTAERAEPDWLPEGRNTPSPDHGKAADE